MSGEQSAEVAGLTDAQRDTLWTASAGHAWRGVTHPPADLFAAVERIVAERRSADMAKAWAEGKATGFSRAMRYMSDEPGVDTNPPNPYSTTPTQSDAGGRDE